MTDAKEKLKSVRRYDDNIINMSKEVARLEEMLTKITSTLEQDRVSSGKRVRDKMSDGAARIIDLRNAINAEIDRFVDARNDVCEVLNKIRNPRHFLVLYKRYILYEKWNVISEFFEYDDDRSVYKLHKKALRTFDKIVNGEKKKGWH